MLQNLLKVLENEFTNTLGIKKRKKIINNGLVTHTSEINHNFNLKNSKKFICVHYNNKMKTCLIYYHFKPQHYLMESQR